MKMQTISQETTRIRPRWCQFITSILVLQVCSALDHCSFQTNLVFVLLCLCSDCRDLLHRCFGPLRSETRTNLFHFLWNMELHPEKIKFTQSINERMFWVFHTTGTYDQSTAQLSWWEKLDDWMFRGRQTCLPMFFGQNKHGGSLRCINKAILAKKKK